MLVNMVTVQEFIDKPSAEGLEDLRKADLLQVATSYQLGPLSNLKKVEIKKFSDC